MGSVWKNQPAKVGYISLTATVFSTNFFFGENVKNTFNTWSINSHRIHVCYIIPTICL